jgi:1,4-alpha-glucan branching enzyme
LPNAHEVYFTGDFNNWDACQYPMDKGEYGWWYITIPANKDQHGNSTCAVPHDTKFKIFVKLENGESFYRNPAWATYMHQDQNDMSYNAVHWNPDEKYQFKHDRPQSKEGLRIYEAHVGMSSSEEKINSFRDFADNVIPRIVYGGYNCIQIMAIMEHAYYGSFGYHVTNFFAVSSRFGTPEDLKYMIDTAHSHGLYVLMDIVHSHASKNVLDGIALQDGTEYQYFHAGEKGVHSDWDSKIFDYDKFEVLRFLLANVYMWIAEYRFDGFRFDAVTSILYHHHGIGVGFSGDYNEYFSMDTDIAGVAYLMLANDLTHSLFKDAITVAEDVSGMPGLCVPIESGGIGFDYRLNMSCPDTWIKYLKDLSDDDWDMKDLAQKHTNRRYKEKTIGYAESHDQALVGDKTLSHRLIDEQIYDGMHVDHHTQKVDRGIALHKMIKLFTFGLGGEAYLNFMGNEFGHPEWVDFPREGNGFSCHYARRQWNLADDKYLKYSKWREFDRDMNKLEEKYPFLYLYSHQYVTLTNSDDKLVVYERGKFVFVFNFHPTRSYEDYRIGTFWNSDHICVLDTDRSEYGGENRLEWNKTNFLPIINDGWNDRPHSIQLYIPARTALVLCPRENYIED